MENFHLMLAGGPWWLYALLVLAAAGLAIVGYRRTMPEIDNTSKWILISLRTIGIAALLIALFEPIARYVRSESTRPRIAFVVDDSRSMHHLWKTNSDEDKRAIISEMANELNVGIEVFDAGVKNVSSADSIQFKGERTEIAAALSAYANMPPFTKPGVVVLLSDGNSNSGDNPLFVAENAGVGIYTIGVGDSIAPLDAGVVSIAATGIAVLGKPVTITVTSRLSSMANTNATLVLEEDGVEIGRDTISTSMSDGRATADFVWTPKKAGIRKLKARVLSLPNEYTQANNSLTEDIEVRSDQRTILLFAGAPSPDVAFIRSELERDPSTKVRLFIQKRGAEFYNEQPGTDAFKDAVACVLIGFPIASTAPNIVQRIADASSHGLSMLFIPSKDVDYSKLGPLKNVVPFQVASTRPNEMQITPDVLAGAASDPLMKIEGGGDDVAVWNTLPPIFRTETFFTPAAQSVTLAKIRTNNVPVNQPLIMKRVVRESRNVSILAYGLYRWKLMGEGPLEARGMNTTDVFGSFIRNCISWLSAKDDENRIRIRATRQRYAAGEQVAFSGSVLDESFAPVAGADVRVKVSSGKGTTEFVLAEIGAGRYTTVAGPMPEGEYSSVGVASDEGREIGRDVSRFSVGALGLEESATSMNKELLSGLAQRTGAQFSHVGNWKSVVQAALTDPRLRPVVVSSERDVVLWHLPWFVAAAICAFTLEWILRKRRGLV